MNVIDDERKADNELCKLLCSLGAFDAHIQTVRKRIEDMDKQGRVITALSSLKDSAKFKALEEKIQQHDDDASVVSELVALVESYNLELKDMKNDNEGLSAVVGSCLADLARLVVTVISKATTHWKELSATLLLELKGLLFLLPDLSPAATCESFSKLQLMEPALSTCFNIFEKISAQFKCDSPKSILDAKKWLGGAKATWQMIATSQSLFIFLVLGKLELTEERLPQATTLVGNFFQAMKKLHDLVGDALDDDKATMTAVISRLEKVGKDFGEELVSPLRTRVFTNIFTHKYMKDHSFSCVLRVVSFLSCVVLSCVVDVPVRLYS